MQYGLIGKHLGHSYSCEIHKTIADYRYELLELRPEELGKFLKKREFLGVNVTIPYKQAVIPYLDEISDTAKRIGAVNTIVNKGGRLCGYNTDFAGMCALARHAGVEISGRKVLILGTGGTSKTAHAVMERLGAKEILHVSRRTGAGAVSYEQAAALHGDAQIIVNTTPVGMYPDAGKTPINIAAFPALEGVLDAVYHPLRTNLVLDGKSRDLPAEGGLYMLAAQAVFASALFQGANAAPALIDRAFRMVRQQKQNIVLIGMPTSGKTTVGRLLAQRTGKSFYDTDDMIASRIGRAVSDYITVHGEAAFRALERESVFDAAERSGCIIATGGGAILDADNVRALQRNGTLAFLNRAPENFLALPDRPLSSDADKLAAMFALRYPLYQNAADVSVDANLPPDAVAEAVLKELEK